MVGGAVGPKVAEADYSKPAAKVRKVVGPAVKAVSKRLHFAVGGGNKKTPASAGTDREGNPGPTGEMGRCEVSAVKSQGQADKLPLMWDATDCETDSVPDPVVGIKLPATNPQGRLQVTQGCALPASTLDDGGSG